MYAGLSEDTWNSFRGRIRRLAQHEFLDQTNVDGIGTVFSLGINGELFLHGKEPTIVERSSRMKLGNRRDQIWHDVEVFEVQVALRRAGVIGLWQFETEFVAKTTSPRTATAKTTTRLSRSLSTEAAHGSRWNTNERANLRPSTSAFAVS